MYCFKTEADVSTDNVPLPCGVSIATRRCRVSDRLDVPETRTSSGFAALLFDMIQLMRCVKVACHFPLDVGGPLEWGHTIGQLDVRSLWAEGRKSPPCPSSAVGAVERSLAEPLGANAGTASSGPLAIREVSCSRRHADRRRA